MMHRPNKSTNLRGLWGCTFILGKQSAAGVLKWSRGFSFALGKAIGVEDVSFVQESPNSVLGHWAAVCSVREMGEERKGKVFPRAAEMLVTVISDERQSNL